MEKWCEISGSRAKKKWRPGTGIRIGTAPGVGATRQLNPESAVGTTLER